MRKRFAGIDIGSRSIELVMVNDSGKIVTSLQTDTGFDPMTAAKDLIHGVAYDCIMATGYGRNLFEISFDTLTVTEIKAHAIGARAFFPNVQAVLDIGGQDSKAISLFKCLKKSFELFRRHADPGIPHLESHGNDIRVLTDDSKVRSSPAQPGSHRKSHVFWCSPE